MAAPSRITDLSATASSNSPSGGETVGTGLDDYLRGIQAVIRGDLATKGADIAAASTTDLGAVQGLSHDITGTTTITSFGTVAAGVWKIIKFEGALTLTHNATSLILPGGANITTADGDVAIVCSEGSGNWRCNHYQRAASSALQNQSGASVAITGGSITGITDLAIADGGTGASTAAGAFANLKQAASDSASGVLEVAVQSEMEAASSTTLAVTPGRQHYHPGMAKAWGYVGSNGTLIAGYNCASAKGSTGAYSITFTTALSSANYCVIVTGGNVSGSGNTLACFDPTSLATTGFTVIHTGNTFITLADSPFTFVVFGDM